MKVAVLGAGVVGITSAYFLNKAGYDVTVIDRQEGPGLETSFANGGQIAAAHAEPWASPSTPFKILKWLGRKDAPLLFHLWRYDPKLWRWSLQFLSNCTRAKTRQNIRETLAIAMKSREALAQVRAETGLKYDHREEGILHFYRNQAEFDKARYATQVMQGYGLNRKVVSVDDCLEIEPELGGVQSQLIGGTYSTHDESGDAYKFTSGLAHVCQQNGVEFLYGQTVEKLHTNGCEIKSIELNGELFEADVFVICMGSYSSQFLQPYGLNLPIYPAKGYSLTFHTDDKINIPSVSLTDDEHKLVFSRLGNRLRVAGTAEFTGYDTSLSYERIAHIQKKVCDIFPALKGVKDVEYWTGLRPKTPNSLPLIGQRKYANMYLNTGHGTLGWTMSCGSAQLLTEQMCAKC